MTVRDELLTWLVEQDLWQQDLARQLVDRTHLEGAELEDAIAMVRAEFGAAPAGAIKRAPTAITSDDLPENQSAEAPRLVAFGRMRGVGAASPDYELRFAPNGLTIIYGQNAAGKTTYVRGLKRVCRAIDCEAAILGNVFAVEGGEVPTAKIEYQSNGELRAQQVELSAPPDLGLQAISVFDARCAELYVDSRNTLAYVPSALLLLARLAATQDKMRGVIQSEIDTLLADLPSFPEFLAPSQVKSLLEGLSATSDLGKLSDLAKLSEEERARLTELRAVTASTNAVQEAQSAEHDAAQAEALANQLEAVGRLVGTEFATVVYALERDLVAAREAVSLAAKEFEALPVPGVGTDPWQRLWEAARRFVESTDGNFPPANGAHCPFCLETISPETATRLQHFEDHIQSAVQAAAREVEQRLQSTVNTLTPDRVAACRGPFLESLTDREPKLHSAVEEFLAAADARVQRIRADAGAAAKDPGPEPPATALREWGTVRAEQGRALRKASDPKEQARLVEELNELEARILLANRLDDVANSIGAHTRVTALRKAHSALATNRITSAQRQLSETAVTAALEEKLRQELKLLRCDHLPINLAPHAAVGEVQLALRLAGAQGNPQIGEIASEGEKRALSLAFFLAEVASSETNGGLVVDDPVSSLDDERREYIAERLAAEAKQRQVIVFTHDLPFMLDLIDRAEEEPSVQAVWRLGGEVGRVDDHPPFKAMKLKARVGALEQQVAQWDAQTAPADFDEAWRRVCDFYARLRIAWERAVEERLFRGVVQRFQREVKTLALKDVAIAPELVEAVNEGMTRCSMYVHDEPPAASVTLPSRTQLAEDLTKLRDFEKETR
ncbi:MAG TPA: AAA family ATPase [Gaiellaceae bacterium]|nr:AAA family ATPase [Gaiellaceae bacterium]